MGRRKRDLSPESPRKRSRIDPPPTVRRLRECTCFECLQHPSLHPETGAASKGRWIDRRDLADHRVTQSKRDTANSLLGTLQPAEMQLPQLDLDSAPQNIFSQITSSGSQSPLFVTVPPSSGEHEAAILAKAHSFLGQLRNADDVVSNQIIVFQTPPKGSVVRRNDPIDVEIDTLCALHPSTESNSSITAFQRVVSDVKSWLNSNQVHTLSSHLVRSEIKSLQKRILEEESRLRILLWNEWLHQAKVAELSFFHDASKCITFDSVHLTNRTPPSAPHYMRQYQLIPPAILAIYIIVATLHLISGVSFETCSSVLKGLRIVVRLLLGKSTSAFAAHMSNAMHCDTRTILDFLDLEPQAIAYASCPQCCTLYHYDPNNPNSYPDVCDDKKAHTVRGVNVIRGCGAKLKRNRNGASSSSVLPVRQYHYRRIQDYVARLYARADLQDYLYGSRREQPNRSSEVMKDILDAPYLRDFLGPDQATPFIECPQGEGRLVFSLNMDGLNPFGNKEAGKKVSVGAMYMVCLNLPPSIRNEIENVYLVGVIPGPSEPSLEQINSFLRPLVDDLLIFWRTGVYISRTLRYPRGILVRCAVVPLVCDLPAARQMSGFASHASNHFCAFCTQTLGDIQNIDRNSWTPRDQISHRLAAAAWRDAPTEVDRAALFNQYGVRWSELLRLPYWDPTRFTVVDSMHAFFLRLFRYHCRDIWGMGVDYTDGEAVAARKHRDQPTDTEMIDAQQILQGGSKSSLKALRASILRELCKQSNLSHLGNKDEVAQRLLQFVSQYFLGNIPLSQILQRIHQGWFTELGERRGKAPTVAPALPPRSIIINPEIQTYAKDGVVPHDLSIQNANDVEDYYRNADNTTMTKMKKPDLLTLFVHKVNSNLWLSPDAVKQLRVPEIRVLVQKQVSYVSVAFNCTILMSR